VKLNDETFYLAQEIFARRCTEAGVSQDLPELAAVAINAAHQFMGMWSTTQDVLEAESQKAVAASTAIAQETTKTTKPGFKRPAVKQKRKKAA
jgi:hypothetical protein